MLTKKRVTHDNNVSCPKLSAQKGKKQWRFKTTKRDIFQTMIETYLEIYLSIYGNAKVQNHLPQIEKES